MDYFQITNSGYISSVFVDNRTGKVSTPLDGGEYTLFMTIEELYKYFNSVKTEKKKPVKPVKKGHCNITSLTDKKATKQRKTK